MLGLGVCPLVSLDNQQPPFSSCSQQSEQRQWEGAKPGCSPRWCQRTRGKAMCAPALSQKCSKCRCRRKYLRVRARENTCALQPSLRSVPNGERKAAASTREDVAHALGRAHVRSDPLCKVLAVEGGIVTASTCETMVSRRSGKPRRSPTLSQKCSQEREREKGGAQQILVTMDSTRSGKPMCASTLCSKC